MTTAEEIIGLIKKELDADPVSAAKLKTELRCLIPPYKEKYLAAGDHVFELWTVLVEKGDYPYCIFFDEEERNFGLGMKGKNGSLHYHAHYGTFMQTLKGM